MGNSQRSCKRILFNMIISTSNRNDDMIIHLISSYQFQPTCLIPPKGSHHGAFLPPWFSTPSSAHFSPRSATWRRSAALNQKKRSTSLPWRSRGAVRFLGGLGTGPRFLVERKIILIIENHHLFRWSGFFFRNFKGVYGLSDPLRCAFNNIKFEVKRIFCQKLKEHFPLPKVGDS